MIKLRATIVTMTRKLLVVKAYLCCRNRGLSKIVGQTVAGRSSFEKGNLVGTCQRQLPSIATAHSLG